MRLSIVVPAYNEEEKNLYLKILQKTEFNSDAKSTNSLINKVFPYIKFRRYFN
ncbi:MAG: hypothetical protein Q7K35_02740 [bacterium]|nr:hypothetical protein [bacterium]